LLLFAVMARTEHVRRRLQLKREPPELAQLFQQHLSVRDAATAPSHKHAQPLLAGAAAAAAAADETAANDNRGSTNDFFGWLLHRQLPSSCRVSTHPECTLTLTVFRSSALPLPRPRSASAAEPNLADVLPKESAPPAAAANENGIGAGVERGWCCNICERVGVGSVYTCAAHGYTVCVKCLQEKRRELLTSDVMSDCDWTALCCQASCRLFAQCAARLCRSCSRKQTSASVASEPLQLPSSDRDQHFQFISGECAVQAPAATGGEPAVDAVNEYEGTWQDGRLHGPAVCRFASGDELSVIFRRGVPAGIARVCYRTPKHCHPLFAAQCEAQFPLYLWRHYAHPDDRISGAGAGSAAAAAALGPGVRIDWEAAPPLATTAAEPAFNGPLDGLGWIQRASECYEGSFSGGRYHGVGILHFHFAGSNAKRAQRNRLHGQFRAGEADGPGQLLFTNGDTFDGVFSAGAPAGGNYRCKSDGALVAAAQWTERVDSAQPGPALLANGAGRITFAEPRAPSRVVAAVQYEGALQGGQPHGQGVLIYRNGDRAEGIFQEGALREHRWLRTADGRVFGPRHCAHAPDEENFHAEPLAPADGATCVFNDDWEATEAIVREADRLQARRGGAQSSVRSGNCGAVCSACLARGERSFPNARRACEPLESGERRRASAAARGTDGAAGRGRGTGGKRLVRCECGCSYCGCRRRCSHT
jgi:hypothetical protein